jgi:hypothetical protein
MTERDYANDPTYRELRAIHEEDDRNIQRDDFVNSEDLILGSHVIGYLRDLPPWAQACIKELRSKLWDERHK